MALLGTLYGGSAHAVPFVAVTKFVHTESWLQAPFTSDTIYDVYTCGAVHEAETMDA